MANQRYQRRPVEISVGGRHLPASVYTNKPCKLSLQGIMSSLDKFDTIEVTYSGDEVHIDAYAKSKPQNSGMAGVEAPWKKEVTLAFPKSGKYKLRFNQKFGFVQWNQEILARS